MEFKIGDGMTIFLPPLHMTIMSIIIIYLLVKWSKQVETQRFKVFLYFLISTYTAPVLNESTKNGYFEIWLPVGYLFLAIYMYGDKNRKNHPAKVKASILGFSLALYQLIIHYFG